MSNVELTRGLLAELAGWEAVKRARSLLDGGRVMASSWQPPLLKGSVREGTTNYLAGLLIRSAGEAENLCSCRDSRQRGIICAHSVAVGLHYLQTRAPASTPFPPSTSPAAAVAAGSEPKVPRKALRRAGSGENGEPLELHLILPPNLAEALGRGRVMLCLEGSRLRGKVPLNALPLDVPFSLSAQDASILDALESLSGGDTPALAILNSAQLTELLPTLIGHPRVTLGRAHSLNIVGEPLALAIEGRLEPNGEIVLRLDDSPPERIIGGDKLWAFQNRTLQPLSLPGTLAALLEGPLRLPRVRVPGFLSLEWPELAAQGKVRANFTLEDFILEPAEPDFRLHLLGGVAMLQARIECFYGATPAAELNDSSWLPDPECPTRYRARNLVAERAAVARLARCGFTGPDAQGLLHLNGQDLVLNFFAREYPRLQKEWRVTLEERLDRRTRQQFERIEPQFEVRGTGDHWFDLEVTYSTSGGERLSPAELQRLLRSGQSHTRLRNGKYALLDTGAVEDLQEVLRDCGPQQQGGAYRLDNTQAGFLEATLREHPRWQVEAPAAWFERAACQTGRRKPRPLPLFELEGVLRPYQKEGVAWLQFLRINGFGGILADEMGLGKTVQVLALFEALRRVPGVGTAGPRLPHLVVCPTSLVFNWAAEASKFTPGLRVLTLHGPQRHERFGEIPQHDLVITSYALVRRDAADYRGLEFDTVVLDEAQHIKNRQTQNAQAVKSLRSRHRLVLTGTPLENSVLDIWSLFDFLMPGYLGAAQDFRERYELPLCREGNADIQSRLARRLRPFLLRRVKREVAADLPERIEQVSFCDLTESQRAFYQQVLEASRREIVNAVQANGLARSRMVVLTALLRLRQICCDLRLLERAGVGPVEAPRREVAANTAPWPGADTSGKVELFHELLEEVLDGGHRVLVFSQFTTMLGLLREELTARNIEFCYLDGATRDRAEVVGRFQRDPAIAVFLISLKAGGVGLNLTGADTVIHFDPWWNPAVEAQATDRAHRLGQKRVVTSYKLVTRGTVEEKILRLQARKRALVQTLLAEEQLAQALDWEDLQELLSD
jgi:SNF2 family DNA or RNA helicase